MRRPRGYTKPWPRNYNELRGLITRHSEVFERAENVETSINTTETDRCPGSWSESAWPPGLKAAPKQVLAHAGNVQWAAIPYIESVSGDRSMLRTPCNSDNRQFAKGCKTSVGPKTKRLVVIETSPPLLTLSGSKGEYVIGAVWRSNRTGSCFLSILRIFFVKRCHRRKTNVISVALNYCVSQNICVNAFDSDTSQQSRQNLLYFFISFIWERIFNSVHCQSITYYLNRFCRFVLVLNMCARFPF